MTRILVPTDFSAPSLAAVRSGLDLATAGGGVVLLLHVVEGASVRCYAVDGHPLFLSDMIDIGGDYFRSRFDQPLIRRDVCEEARWQLDALIPPRCQARVHSIVTVGRVVEEIVRVATAQHADLILLGARGRRGWRHLFRRTVADRVRRQVLIPVVTLAADDLRVGRHLGRPRVPAPQLASGRARSPGAERVGGGKARAASPGLPHLASTAPRTPGPPRSPASRVAR